MTRPFKTAWVLLVATTTITLALSGFTAYNFRDFEKAVAVDPIYCGTTDYSKSFRPNPITDPVVSAGEILFKANCKACHSLDQKLVGPALRNAYSGVPGEKWLRNWITNSSKMIAAGDPYAVQLFEEYNKTQMTNYTTMKKEDLNALIAYLKYVEAETMAIPNF